MIGFLDAVSERLKDCIEEHFSNTQLKFNLFIVVIHNLLGVYFQLSA